MADLRVASRYVKSLLSLAVEQGVLDEVYADMQLFTKVSEENRAFALMLKNPIIKHSKKKEVLEKLFKGKVNKLTMAIFNIITLKHREPILISIAKEFHNAYNTYKNIGKASVTTAFPLDESLRAELNKIAKGLTDRANIELTEVVDKDIIGGFVLNVGDKQIDASVKHKLDALKVKFSQNFYIKEL
jgi:F-type H+-transporting ATPase subunit delta